MLSKVSKVAEFLIPCRLVSAILGQFMLSKVSKVSEFLIPCRLVRQF